MSEDNVFPFPPEDRDAINPAFLPLYAKAEAQLGRELAHFARGLFDYLAKIGDILERSRGFPPEGKIETLDLLRCQLKTYLAETRVPEMKLPAIAQYDDLVDVWRAIATPEQRAAIDDLAVRLASRSSSDNGKID